MEPVLERALHDDDAWAGLVEGRQEQLREFLRWAAAREAGTRKASLRLENRDDIVRCREVIDMFDEPWWAVVVSSCFDSTTGTRVAAPHFRTAVSPVDAERPLVGLDFPRGSVQHHRVQSLSRNASIVGLGVRQGRRHRERPVQVRRRLQRTVRGAHEAPRELVGLALGPVWEGEKLVTYDLPTLRLQAASEADDYLNDND